MEGLGKDGTNGSTCICIDRLQKVEIAELIVAYARGKVADSKGHLAFLGWSLTWEVGKDNVSMGFMHTDYEGALSESNTKSFPTLTRDS